MVFVSDARWLDLFRLSCSPDAHGIQSSVLRFTRRFCRQNHRKVRGDVAIPMCCRGQSASRLCGLCELWPPFFVLSVLRLYLAYIHVKESWSFILSVPFNHEAEDQYHEQMYSTQQNKSGRYDGPAGSNGNLIRLYVVHSLDAGIEGYKLPSINFRYRFLFYPLLHKLLQVGVYCTRRP